MTVSTVNMSLCDKEEESNFMPLNGLPENWEVKKLGDLVEKQTIKALPTDFPDSKFIGMDCIEPHTMRPSFLYDFRDFKSAGNYFEAGQVLYGRMRPYLNKVYKAEFSGACSGEFIVLECLKDFSPDLLQYILHSRGFVRFVNEKTSGDRPRISFDEICDYPILLPPIDEQERIVAKIEEFFSELDAGVESLKKAQAQLKTYRQAVLKSAFEGRLTNKQVFDGELPSGWVTTKIEDVASVGTGATPLKSNSEYYRNGKIPWVTSGAVNNDFVREATDFVTDKALAETNLSIYPVHTLLLAMYGEGKTRGKCSELLIEACTNQAIAAIHFDGFDSRIKPYLKSFLLKNYYDIRRKSSGGVQPNINLGIVKKIEFPLPPFDEQHRIVEEIESRLSVCDKLEETIAASLKQSEALRQSILKQAFEGRLASS